MFTQLEQLYSIALATEDLDPNSLTKQELVDDLREDIITAYNEREQELGEDLMRGLERFILLQIIDERWREHLHDIDYMREGIHLRGFAQEEPLVAYKNEAFNMFGALIQSIWEEFARYIFNVEIEITPEDGGGDAGQMWQPPTGSSSTGNIPYAGGGMDQPSALAAAAAAANGEYYAEDEEPQQKIEQVRRE